MAGDAHRGEELSTLRCCSHGMGPHSVFAAQQPRVKAPFSMLPPPPHSRVHIAGVEIGGGSIIVSPREMGFNEVLNNKMG